MKPKQFVLPRLLRIGTLGLLLALACGCNSVPDAKNSTEPPPKVVAASESGNPGINLQCAADHIQKALAPFHWSFKKIVTPGTNADWEADVTQDTIAGKLLDGSGTRPIHGSRSDQTSWNTAVLILSGPLPASTFSLVDNSSATTPAGTETVNQVTAIKYAIDTSKDTAAEASLIRTMLGPGGFVKGAAWVASDGCPVKFAIDVEQHNKDGSLDDKEHYELNVTQQQ